jgi:cytochrome c oxidase accessory protein FixG
VAGALLIALPLTNGVRLDCRAGIFYFAWHRMAAHDLVLWFWICMLGTMLVAAVSYLYGRIWCGWACPQSFVSDFAVSLRKRIELGLRARKRRSNAIAAQSVWTAAILAASLGGGYVLAAYWLDPRQVAHALVAPWSDTAAAATAYGLAAIIAADMFFVRRRFCTHFCPYGVIFSTLADTETLVVRYLTERDDDCIRCGQCVAACPTGIDIRKGVAQVECISCGECADACNSVLTRRGKPGLIEFRYGTAADRVTRSLPVAKRLGLWDPVRIGMLAGVVICAGVVAYSLWGCYPLRATVIANGAVVRSGSFAANSYQLTISNGAPESRVYRVSAAGISGARVTAPSGSVRVAGRDRVTETVTVGARVSTPGSARMPIGLRVVSPQDRAVVQTIFYVPPSAPTAGRQ